MAILLQFLVALSFPHLILCEGMDGVDVSTALSEDDFHCLNVNYEKKFAIVRVWRSNGVVDENGAQNLKNAGSSGIYPVDGYIFPCFKCHEPKGQISKLLHHLDDEKRASYGRLWLDIEDPSMWSLIPMENVVFVQAMVDELEAHSKSIGIYTSLSQWSSIMGGSTHFSSKYYLWYAHYDGNRTTEDFVPFAGWTSPKIKQYKSDVSNFCGVKMNENWWP